MHDTSEFDNQENHQSRHHAPRLRTILSDKSHRLADKINSWTLFAKIAVWVLLALITFIMLSLGLSGKGWGIKLIEYLGIGAKPYQKTTIALTLVGGIGAVGYLVIKYQERTAAQRAEQRTIEKQETENLLTAIHLLGDDKPSTRIAGVQSLVEIGQNHPDTRQRVIDILCGYLRTDRGEKDGPVESTILKTLQLHLVSPQDNFKRESQISNLNTQELYWNSIDIDLHNSTFTEEVDFSHIKCRSFDMCNAKLSSAKVANFCEAVFENSGYFCGIDFTSGGHLNFIRAEFKGFANFSHTNLCSANFREVKIAKGDFSKSELIHTNFSKAHIYNTKFEYTKLNHPDFNEAIFDSVYFGEASFTNPCFRTSSITNSFFNDVKLIDADFDHAGIINTCFNAIKIKDSYFCDAFLKKAKFSNSSFENINFKSSQFVTKTAFRDVVFNKYANFRSSLIGDPQSSHEEEALSFTKSNFFCNPNFTDINCYDPIVFKDTHFLKNFSRLIHLNTSIKTQGELLFDLDSPGSKQSCTKTTREK